MEVELSSDWMVTQIELLKCLHGYEMKEIDDEIGSVDYVASEGDHEKKLLRVIIAPKLKTLNVDMDATRRIIRFIEKEDYDEAVILAEKFSGGAKKLIRGKERLSYISSDMDSSHSIVELGYAIEKKTLELCKLRCGKAPKSESDCKGYQGGEYTCQVRRISDNADFHTERRWPRLMMNDFSRLVTLQREMNE